MRVLTLLALLLLPAALFSAIGPVTSNGFDHYVFWQTELVGSDNLGALYHVSVKGAEQDTHRIKRYTPH